jgi:hypothetical protein
MNKHISLLMSIGLTAGSLSFGALTLVSAWDFNEGTGTTTNQATLTGPETWNQVTNPTQVLAGTASNAFTGIAAWGAASPAQGSTASLTFNDTGGGNQLDMNVSGAALAGTGAKTFVAWINPTGLDANGAGIISYSPTNGTLAGSDLRFMLDVNGDLRAEVNSGAFAYTTSPSLVGGGWKMVAAIFDGNTNTSSFYIGGVGFLTPDSVVARAINTSATAASSGITDIVIGGQQFGVTNRSFVGGIDSVAVYSGAATLSELDNIYTNGIAIPEPGTLALVGVALGSLLLFRRRKV